MSTEEIKDLELENIVNPCCVQTTLERCRLILTDIMTPGMSGIEPYKNFHKTAQSLAERIVLIAGDVIRTNTQKIFSKTGAYYIAKTI